MENMNQNHFGAPAILLYGVAVGLFAGIISANLRVIETLTEGPNARKKDAASTYTFFITLVSNFIGAATIALLGKTSGIAARMSMVALPALLLAERHLRSAVKDAKDRTVHLWGAAGGLLGVLAGAWFFLRGGVDEQLRRLGAGGDVQTLRVQEVLERQQHMGISWKLVAIYVAALSIFWVTHWGLRLSSEFMAKELREPRTKALLTALVSALVLNFFGVGALVLIGESAQVPIRLAMVLVPLFIVVESYVLLLRSDRENRYGHWAGLLGSAAGMAGAALLMLRSAPLY